MSVNHKTVLTQKDLAFVEYFSEHFDNLSDDMQSLVAKAVARQTRNVSLCKSIVNAEMRPA